MGPPPPFSTTATKKLWETTDRNLEGGNVRVEGGLEAAAAAATEEEIWPSYSPRSCERDDFSPGQSAPFG